MKALHDNFFVATLSLSSFTQIPEQLQINIFSEYNQHNFHQPSSNGNEFYITYILVLAQKSNLHICCNYVTITTSLT